MWNAFAPSTPNSPDAIVFGTLDGVVGNLASRLLRNPNVAVFTAKEQARQHRTTHDVSDDVAHKNKMLTSADQTPK